MPQFDLAVFSHQIFWLTICFVMLYSFTLFYSVPRLQKGLDARWEQTEGATLEAQRIEKEALQIKKNLEQALNEARAEAQDLISQETKKLSTEITARKHKITADIKDKFTTAERRYLEHKVQALVECQGLAQNLSTEIVTKLVHDSVTVNVIQGLVAAAIKEQVANDV